MLTLISAAGNSTCSIMFTKSMSLCGDFPSSGVRLLASVLSTIYGKLPMLDTIGLSGTCGLCISDVPYM